MDCSPEYVVNYCAEEEQNRFQNGGISVTRDFDQINNIGDKPRKQKQQKTQAEQQEMESKMVGSIYYNDRIAEHNQPASVVDREQESKLVKVTRSEECAEAVTSQVDVVTVEKPATTLKSTFPYPSNLKLAHAQLKRLFIAKRHWERKLGAQRLAEEKHEGKVEHRIKNLIPTMLCETETAQQRNEVLQQEIQRMEFDMIEEGKAMQSKIKSVEILTGLFDGHKGRSLKSMQSILDNMNDYIMELVRDEIKLYNKLFQKWRFFGKSKLRAEVRSVEILRARTECVAQKLQKEINYLALGEFKLSPK